jgi:L-alanine-DL-glutamate epimerase-like enolase superfamily enzyme
MSLLFFPRGLDEIRFEECLEPDESAGHRWLMPSGNTDIHATENLFYDIRAFESAA